MHESISWEADGEPDNAGIRLPQPELNHWPIPASLKLTYLDIVSTWVWGHVKLTAMPSEFLAKTSNLNPTKALESTSIYREYEGQRNKLNEATKASRMQDG